MDDVHNILNIRRNSIRALTNNGESVTAVTIVVAEDDVICRAANRQTIISIINDVVLEDYVCALYVEAYRMA